MSGKPDYDPWVAADAGSRLRRFGVQAGRVENQARAAGIHSVADRVDITTTKNYSQFASCYDESIGNALFPDIWDSFEHARRRHRIRFGSAADIGCGTGTFLRHLARFGTPLFGVDRSRPMLRIAIDKNRAYGTRFIESDIRSFQLPRKVDLITCNGDTLNYLLTTDAVAAALRRFWSQLNPAGWLIFDILAAGTWNSTPTHAADAFPIAETDTRWRLRTDPRRRLSAVEILTRDANADGRPGWVRELHIQRWFPVKTIHKLLRHTGFEPIDAFDTETLKPVSDQSTWIKLVARKSLALAVE